MNYEDPEQPLQPIKKIDDEVLDRFINTYGFKQEVRDTKKGEQQLNIASASIGDNIYIIRKKGQKNYSFLSVSKENFDNFRGRKNEGFTFKFIDFDTDYFKKNEQKFIKSLKENKMFDDKKVKDGDYGDFEKKIIQALTNHPSDRIKIIDPKEIKDIQPEPVQEKELMGDDDEEEEERMVDEEEEDAAKQRLGSSFGRDEEEKQRKEIEERKRKMKEEEDKEYEKQKKVIFSDDYQNGLYKYDRKQKQRSGVMKKEDMDVFDQLQEELGFTKVKGPGGQSYLRVGDDVIFIRKVPEKKKDSAIFKNDPYLAVKLNEEDFKKLYNNQNISDIKAEYFNFNTDYFNENKDKFKKAIKEGEFAFDDYIKEAKERLKKAGIRSNIGDKFTYDQIKEYGILPGKKKFDYVKMFDLKRGNISEERGDDGQQLIKFSKDGKNVTVNLPNKYLSNGYPDSLLKLIVGVSENNKGEVDFKEIGEIQDLNGDITNLYSDMQDLKSKINSSNNAEEKERLLIKYNQKRLKLEDRVKKYSKEAYRLSTLKKKKATMATHKYLMNKLNKLKT